jgi:DUF1680 family protein
MPTTRLFAAESPQLPSDYAIKPVAAVEVQFQDAFWQPRLEMNRTVTIPYCLEKCEQTGRIENFKVAGGLSEARWTGLFGYNDSDVAKIIEGAAYSLMAHPDPQLAAYLANLADYYAAAQEDDGYLYTLWTARHTIDDYDTKVCRPNKDRWDNLSMSHELYNLGHMYEAAFAHYQATGKPSLLDVAKKSADLLVRHFGPDKFQSTSGHEEVELGLVKLYRATGNPAYLQLAKFFLDMRGHTSPQKPKLWGEYNQDHKPVVDQDAAVGHAVRAMYLYAAMADVAALTGDKAYIQAIDRIWTDAIGKKLYITGGVGAHREGEAFGNGYELPNLSAYCETCAAIGNCLWNYRMFLLHGDARYIDVLERTLYNGVLSGVGFDGKTFFYPNPLESHGEHQRSPWFDCACCPTNVCRFIPSVPGFAYAVRDDIVYVNLFVTAQAKLEVGSKKLTLEQQTDYPWDGKIRIVIRPEQFPQRFTLNIRIPGWSTGQPVPSDLYRYLESKDDHLQAPAFTVISEGAAKPADVQIAKGYAAITREWHSGDAVQFELSMPVRRVLAHDKVEADRGRVALQRGPLVYCVEHPDVPDGAVLNLVLPDEAKLSVRAEPAVLGGVRVIEGEAQSIRSKEEGAADKSETTGVPLKAIPYYAWAHRGPGQMAVWLPRTPEAATPLPPQKPSAEKSESQPTN